MATPHYPRETFSSVRKRQRVATDTGATRLSDRRFQVVLTGECLTAARARAHTSLPVPARVKLPIPNERVEIMVGKTLTSRLRSYEVMPSRWRPHVLLFAAAIGRIRGPRSMSRAQTPTRTATEATFGATIRSAVPPLANVGSCLPLKLRVTGQRCADADIGL